MSELKKAAIQRRDFIKQAGGASVLGLQERLLFGASRQIVIVKDSKISERPVVWAVGELRQAIEAQNAAVKVVGSPSDVTGGSLYIVVAGSESPLADGFPNSPALSQGPEAFRICPGKLSGKPAMLVSGSDQKGFVYALLELTDRVRSGSDPMTSLHFNNTVSERPANQIRSITRAFVTDVEDKDWYYDKAFWRNYLSDLMSNRFNRFSLAFGMGYDFPRGVTEDYFHFVYPYLFDVPGYNVRVVPLSNAERDKNLEMLKFITDETARRGLDCQIGIWTHAYQWVDSPNAEHHVEGLTPETHANYCRDALHLLLETCPAIQGLTFRVHGESGIPEGSYSFWRTLFDGIVRSKRRIEIDMHAKGTDQTIIDIASQTGMPVKLSPKFWAEHMGLPYQQAAIREEEMPRPDADNTGVFKLSSGSRRFLRYGYGDLLKDKRNYGILFRLWPGTQRVLLWGDPSFAAGYGRTSHFCGSSGIEICEPLFFKGREGSGLPGGRCGYSDQSLKPKDGDWSKFRYTYRVWGRLLYNPEADAQQWQRYLQSNFGAAATPVENAIAQASRVLPLITTAHLPSASNNSYWPEMYTNMPVVEGSEIEPYSDTTKPKRFGTVSPLDPELFSTMQQHAAELCDGQASGKYSPIEVAQWLEDLSEKASQSLADARRRVKSATDPEFRRLEEDLYIETGLARFFAAKFRSGVLYEIYQRTKDPSALEQAISAYKKARAAWSSMAEREQKVYRADITYGPQRIKRGNWADRIPAIDKDLIAMEALQKSSSQEPARSDSRVASAILTCTGRPTRVSIRCTHTPPPSFTPGQPVSISLQLDRANKQTKPSAARLRYRQVNQAERWVSTDMDQSQHGYSANIPGDYTNSPYALQYYFEFQGRTGSAWLYPGFDAELSNQPYFLIERA